MAHIDVSASEKTANPEESASPSSVWVTAHASSSFPTSDFFEIVALSEPLDRAMLGAKASREQIAEAIQGKVVGWGLWTASAERRWG